MVKLSSERSDRPCKALSFSHSGKFLATAQDGPQAQSSGNDEKIEVASLLCIYLHCFADEMLEALCMCLHSRLGESSPAQVSQCGANPHSLKNLLAVTPTPGAGGHAMVIFACVSDHAWGERRWGREKGLWWIKMGEVLSCGMHCSWSCLTRL